MAGKTRLTTPALVLRKYDFRESSRILHLFTREAGLLSVLAKGAQRHRSPFTGALDLGHRLEARLSLQERREIQLLSSATVTVPRGGLGRDPLRLTCAGHLIEAALAALPEGRSDPALFDLLDSGLSLVEHFPLARLATAVTAWETRLLDVLGQGFTLDACPECGSPLPGKATRVAFSVAGGGPLCRRHRQGHEHTWLDREVLDLLAAFRSRRARDLAALEARPEHLATAGTTLRKALAYRLEKRLRAAPILQGMLERQRP